MTHRIRLFKKDEAPLILMEGDITGDIYNELSGIYYSVDEDDRKKRVIFDFSGVDYINSSGIAALIDIITSNEKLGGNLECFQPKPQIENILRITGLVDYIKISYE